MKASNTPSEVDNEELGTEEKAALRRSFKTNQACRIDIAGSAIVSHRLR